LTSPNLGPVLVVGVACGIAGGVHGFRAAARETEQAIYRAR
jgi:hypothetical protein